MFLPIGHKPGKDVEGMLLLWRRRQAQSLTDTVFQFVLYHFGYKVTKYFVVYKNIRNFVPDYANQ